MAQPDERLANRNPPKVLCVGAVRQTQSAWFIRTNKRMRIVWNWLDLINVKEINSRLIKACRTGPALRGASRDCAPQNRCLCPPPPSKDYASNKVTSSVSLECSLGSEAPKILIINSIFVGKNRFFEDFAMKTFFLSSSQNSKNFTHILRRTNLFLFLVFTLEFEGKSFCVCPKNYLCPPSHATLAPGLLPEIVIYKATPRKILTNEFFKRSCSFCCSCNFASIFKLFAKNTNLRSSGLAFT